MVAKSEWRAQPGGRSGENALAEPVAPGGSDGFLLGSEPILPIG